MDWASSDWHFDHTNVIKYCNRPFDNVHEMNETIIENMNSSMSPEDTLHFYGDFAFCNIEKQKQFFSRINVAKIIIHKGNHDRSKKRLLEIGFHKVYTTYQDRVYKGIRFRESHYPFAPQDHDVIVRFEERRPPRENIDWLICGHIHDKWANLENQINVAVDVRDFKPISFDEIVELTKILDPNYCGVGKSNIHNY